MPVVPLIVLLVVKNAPATVPVALMVNDVGVVAIAPAAEALNTGARYGIFRGGV